MAILIYLYKWNIFICFSYPKGASKYSYLQSEKFVEEMCHSNCNHHTTSGILDLPSYRNNNSNDAILQIIPSNSILFFLYKFIYNFILCTSLLIIYELINNYNIVQDYLSSIIDWLFHIKTNLMCKFYVYGHFIK